MNDKAHMLIGAVFGAVGMFLVTDWLMPSHEQIIRKAWLNEGIYNSIETAGTGNLMSVRDRIAFELECRPDRAEFEEALRAVRRAAPQVLPWCKNPELIPLFDPVQVERARAGR